ncbi:hypothetical protein ES703_66507 [subsurface metagenome]
MVTTFKPSEKEIERRQELVSQSKIRYLTPDETNELQAILYKELHHDYRVAKIGLLAYLALHAIISYLGYYLRMEALDSGNILFEGSKLN